MSSDISMTEQIKLAGTPSLSMTDQIKNSLREGGNGTVVGFPRIVPPIVQHAGALAPESGGPARTIAPGPREQRSDPAAPLRSDAHASSVGSGRPPAASDAPRRRLLPWGFKLVGIAILVFVSLLATSKVVGPDRPALATTQKRVVLVIGNSAYRHTPRLENPKNDAADVAAALRKLGFRVIEGYDLDKAGLDRKIREFIAALRGAEVGVLFYAGHGLLVSGQTYLVPVDAQLASTSALDIELVRLDLVHREMEKHTATNILFFDACRDNPLSLNLARAMGTRSAEIGRGAAVVESGAAGTLISFSTQPGKVAHDGTGRNSPYSRALLKQLTTSTDELGALLIAVRKDVMKETDRKQVPWEHTALTARFYFNPAADRSTSTAEGHLRSREAFEAWSVTKDTTNIALLETFVVRFRDTFYAELARARIEELRQATMLLPPSGDGTIPPPSQ